MDKKILELTNFSAGICGVWQRAKQESIELSRRGYEVRVFSSNAVKGSDEIAKSKESIGNIKITRFPFKKIGGESFMHWNFEKEALNFSPDIIIAHSYRHLHTLKALKIAKMIRKQGEKCRVFLVTHAPFVDTQRNFIQKIIVRLYDLIFGRKLNQFEKVLAITQWEIPYLLKLGVSRKNIVYSPNGIPEEFFKIKIKNGNGLLFLGRISPVKNIETAIDAVKESGKALDIVGPEEKEYREYLDAIIRKNKISNVRFFPPVYEINKKIELIDKNGIFILPSRTESMPQSLIEAMARGKICISSGTRGGNEIIENGRNGFLFEIGSVAELKKIIEKISNMPEKEKNIIRKNAIKTAEKFKLKKIVDDLEKLF